MGVNMAGFAIVDDAVCQEASRMEILRRYYAGMVDRVRGKCDDDVVRKLEIIMQQAGVTPDICPAVAACLKKAEETAAPAGYNQLTKDITIVLNKDGSATIDSASSTLGADHSLTAGVANSTGTMLPETGGIGTVIFVALGALAVICAGVFLVTNKRMSKESF